MGIEMYLTGDKFVPEHQDKFPRAKVDSYPVEGLRLKMGYWRSHWALHNYIEENYSEGEGCNKIELGPIALREIADAVEEGDLMDYSVDPETEAFHTEPEQVAETLKILRDAADWLDKIDNTWKSVEYYGSY